MAKTRKMRRGSRRLRKMRGRGWMNRARNLGTRGLTAATSGLATAKNYGTRGLATAKNYGTRGLATAKNYGTRGLATAKNYGTRGLNYGKQKVSSVKNYFTSPAPAPEKKNPNEGRGVRASVGESLTPEKKLQLGLNLATGPSIFNGFGSPW